MELASSRSVKAGLLAVALLGAAAVLLDQPQAAKIFTKYFDGGLNETEKIESGGGANQAATVSTEDYEKLQSDRPEWDSLDPFELGVDEGSLQASGNTGKEQLSFMMGAQVMQERTRIMAEMATGRNGEMAQMSTQAKELSAGVLVENVTAATPAPDAAAVPMSAVPGVVAEPAPDLAAAPDAESDNFTTPSFAAAWGATHNDSSFEPAASGDPLPDPNLSGLNGGAPAPGNGFAQLATSQQVAVAASQQQLKNESAVKWQLQQELNDAQVDQAAKYHLQNVLNAKQLDWETRSANPNQYDPALGDGIDWDVKAIETIGRSALSGDTDQTGKIRFVNYPHRPMDKYWNTSDGVITGHWRATGVGSKVDPISKAAAVQTYYVNNGAEQFRIYSSVEAKQCLKGRRVSFAGESYLKQTFLGLADILLADPTNTENPHQASAHNYIDTIVADLVPRLARIGFAGVRLVCSDHHQCYGQTSGWTHPPYSTPNENSMQKCYECLAAESNAAVNTGSDALIVGTGVHLIVSR